MTSAYDRTLTPQTLGEEKGSQELARWWGRGDYVIAEVKFFYFKHPAHFGGKSHGRPDF